MASISELEKWVHDQKLRKWTKDHMSTNYSTALENNAILNAIFINAATASPAVDNRQPVINENVVQRRNRNRNFARNLRNFFQQRNQNPPEQTFVARARIPSIYKRVLAEVIDSVLLVGLRVLFLLCYYSPSWSETFSPTVEVLDNIISDLSASIILQSSLLDEALLDASYDDMDMTEEFLSSWLSSLSFRVCAMVYESVFVATCGGTIGKRLLGMKVYSPENVEWVEGGQVQLNNCTRTKWKGAIMRSMFKNLSSLLMIPGHMTPLFNRMRRAIYDSVAGTIVVEKVIIQAS